MLPGGGGAEGGSERGPEVGPAALPGIRWRRCLPPPGGRVLGWERAASYRECVEATFPLFLVALPRRCGHAKETFLRAFPRGGGVLPAPLLEKWPGTRPKPRDPEGGSGNALWTCPGMEGTILKVKPRVG